jgi:O-methyltransferase
MTVDCTSRSSRLEAAQAGLAAAREIVAAGPAAGEAELRAAYLELLKLALCDLVGTTTTSVGRSPEGDVWAREVSGDGRRIRAAGMDWPAHGLTMLGLRRLDDLQACVESVARDGVEGDLIEAGVWRGGASLLMRATLDVLGDAAREVWVADSFAGFPLDEAPVDADEVPLGVIDFLSVPLEEVKASFARLGLERGVRFLPGFFADTLPSLGDQRFSLVRLDADTYETTRLALSCLYPRLSVGGYLVVDDYGAVEECAAAVDDFRRENGINEPLHEIDWTGVSWQRAREQPIATPPAPAPTHGSAQPATRGERTGVPTLDEVALRTEVEELRARVAQLEAELKAAGSLRARVRGWLAR